MKYPLLSLSLLLMSCAATQEITMNEPSQDHGELIIQFSDNIRNVRATLDNRLVQTQRRLTKEMRLYNLPPGEHTLQLAVSSWELKDDINLEQPVTIHPGEQTAVIVSVPPKSGGYWAFQIATYVVTMSLVMQTLY